MPEFPGRDALLASFNLLMEELFQGEMRRGKFQAWEIEILLDIESCDLRGSAKRRVLREYQDAVQTGLEKGARLPLKFSDYLEVRDTNRHATQARQGGTTSSSRPKTRTR
jgi:hypothetical protein